MKVDQKTLAANREAILQQAGKLFREHGIEGVTIAEITAAAGMTHGGFYGHFESKTALVAESCRTSLQASAARWRKVAKKVREAGGDPVAALIDDYLTPARRDSRERSCVLAALGAEVSRDPTLQPAMAEGARLLTEVLTELIAERHPDAPPGTAEQAALATLAAMSGGLSLARTLADTPDLSTAALTAAAALAKRAADRST
jgi:TetR/AcrR family transcriptional repressor of nem operon